MSKTKSVTLQQPTMREDSLSCLTYPLIFLNDEIYIKNPKMEGQYIIGKYQMCCLDVIAVLIG